MGRGNEDWSNGKIYRIISNNPEISVVYFGSTVQSLCRRMAGHRGHFKKWLSGKEGKSSMIFDHFKLHGIEQFHIELVEDFPCDNEQQLLTRENVYIRGFDCCNKHSAVRTSEEGKEYQKQYAQDNKEKISIYQKQYYQDNAESINIKSKQYWQDNKDEISIKRKETITCSCGCITNKKHLNRHLKSKKHISLVQNLK
jgi:hypothetical protein